MYLRASTAVSTRVVRHLLPRTVCAIPARQSYLAACSVTRTPASDAGDLTVWE